jgi:DNA-binding transcriptional ArsR family regulator
MPDLLSSTFSALADPTRRAILAHLASGEATVNELAEPFEISLPAVSRHLKVLEGAGLISRGREAQWRPCKLEPDRLKAVDDWLSVYRRFWEQSFDKMAAYLEELPSEGEHNARPKKKRRR